MNDNAAADKATEISFDLYAILLTINQLERAWIKGYFSSDASSYHKSIQPLISQYNSIQATMDRPLESIIHYCDLQTIDLAIKRVKKGTTAGVDTENDSNRKRIAEATSAFITLLDAIKLHLNTKQDLHPLLTQVIVKCQDSIGEDAFKDKSKLVPWLIKLNHLQDQSGLDNDDLSKFLTDVEQAYDNFIDGL